jgi:hypothetical protein
VIPRSKKTGGGRHGLLQAQGLGLLALGVAVIQFVLVHGPVDGLGRHWLGGLGRGANWCCVLLKGLANKHCDSSADAKSTQISIGGTAAKDSTAPSMTAIYHNRDTLQAGKNRYM